MTNRKGMGIGKPLYRVKPLPSDKTYQEYICERSDGKLSLTTRDKAATFDSGFQSLGELLKFHHIEQTNITKIDTTHAIVGVWKCIVEEVRLTKDKERARELEREICEKFEVPFEEKGREEYYEKNIETNEVYHFTVEEE